MFHLPVFFLEPHSNQGESRLHTLDVLSALSFYLYKTKPFRVSSKLFVQFADRSKSQAISTQRLPEWVFSYIKTCYVLASLDPSVQIRTQSTRTQVVSAPLLRNIPISEICKAAICGSVSTFMRHYYLG